MNDDEEWTTETVEIASLCRDRELQSRAATDDDTIDSYAELLERGVELPAPVVFREGDRLRVADGHHTIAAHEERGKTSIVVRVRSGTRENAVLYAARANAAHGLRRTNKDKRRAVELVLGLHAEWSNGLVAAHCSVSDGLVKGVRADLGLPETSTRVDRRGREMNVGRIGHRVGRDTSAGAEGLATSTDAPSPSSSVRLSEERGADDDSSQTPGPHPAAVQHPDANAAARGDGDAGREDGSEKVGDDAASTEIAPECHEMTPTATTNAALAYQFDRWSEDMMLVSDAAELLGLGTEAGHAIDIDVDAVREHVAARLEEVRQRYCEANVDRALEAVNRYNEMTTTLAFKEFVAGLTRVADISDDGPLRRRQT